jgi:Cdc6-like AAA superfamily ATPase
MWEAQNVYRSMLFGLFGKNDKKKPQFFLNELLKKGRGGPKLVVLDEVDRFIKDEKFLYNLL